VKTDTLLAAAGPVLHRYALPGSERRTLTSAHAAGKVVRVLPGTYLPRELADDFDTLIRAVNTWNPRAVVVGAAAARLTFWPTLPVEVIDVALRGRLPTSRGYRFERRSVDQAQVRYIGEVRVASPALAAIDLVASLGGDAIDTCLRSRRALLSDLWTALKAHPHRRGNAEIERLLRDSRDKPWSAAERLAHRLLRRHRIAGWTANLEVTVAGRTYFIDIAFPRARLAIEIDGRLHEDDPDIFEEDRFRQNDLVGSGWHVLRFTYDMLVNHPAYVIACIRKALAAL
jgi:very-short-patch-repair endonuclease